MAFNGNNMTPVGGNARSGLNQSGRNAPMEWAYQSTVDDLAAVLTSGYFDTFNIYLAPGQFINVSLTDGKFILTVGTVDRALKQVVLDTKVFKPLVGTPGTGDVSGPGASINDDIVLFDGTDGKKIKDSGKKIADLGDVKGPGSSVVDNFASYSNLTGKLIKDSGKKAADFGDVSGPGSSTNSRLALFNGATGKAIKESSILESQVGDVKGPGISIDSRLVLFNAVTGKLIKQSSILESQVGDVKGPGVAVNNNFASFSGATGKLIQDSGTSVKGLKRQIFSIDIRPNALKILNQPLPIVGNRIIVQQGISATILAFDREFNGSRFGWDITSYTSGLTVEIEGDSVNEITGLISLGDIEIISISEGVGLYVGLKHWKTVASITFDGGSVYSANALALNEFRNLTTPYKILGYQAKVMPDAVAIDMRLRIYNLKINDSVLEQFELKILEDISLHVSGTLQVTDYARIGARNYSYPAAVPTPVRDGKPYDWTQEDFEAHFSEADITMEPEFGEGLIVEITDDATSANTIPPAPSQKLDYFDIALFLEV